MREVPIPLEEQLERKLALYREIHSEYYTYKDRVRYLGQWLFRLSGELTMLRTDIRQETDETIDGQLTIPGVNRWQRE